MQVRLRAAQGRQLVSGRAETDTRVHLAWVPATPAALPASKYSLNGPGVASPVAQDLAVWAVAPGPPPPKSHVD